MHYKKIILNKYIIAMLLLVLLLIFNDRNSIFNQLKYREQLNKATKENTFLKEQIAKASKESNELFSNNKNLEKFAREKYLMKRDDEDVYVIIDEKEIKNNEIQKAK
ncbi:MAG: septum formation initiator family protein [Bacteroidetes bacterium]|nr:septum formation initiator family protein [Bacteroidota bacterium]